MAQAPIISPTAANTNQPWLAQRLGIAEASSGAFLDQQFVKAQGSGSGQTLIKVANTGTTPVVYGLAQRAAIGSSGEPYLTPTGTTHLPVEVLGGMFWVNTMTGTGAVGTGSATALVAGSTYEVNSFTTSGYSGIQGLDAASTGSSTTGFFKYEGQVHPDDAAADTNARVLVSVVANRQ